MGALSSSLYRPVQQKRLDELGPYSFGSNLQFCDNCNGLAQTVRVEGWSVPEAWGIWTCGKQAILAMRLPNELPSELTLIARLHAITDGRTPQEADVLINGQKVGRWTFATAEQEVRRLTIPSAVAVMRQPMEISFLVDHPLRPSSLGSSADDRPLGLALHELRIEAATCEGDHCLQSR
jgi:hypothetical protein